MICACALLLCVPAWAQVTYQVDDGTIENAVTITSGGAAGDIWWANAFTVVAGGETIDEIQIAFVDVGSGGPAAGSPFSVHVYEDSDDDGDPTTGTLTLLASASATVADATGETFQSIPIGPVTVSGGFFIAALRTPNLSEYPAAMDETSPQGASWVAGAAAGGLDPADPVGTSSVLAPTPVGNLGLDCNFTLRAVSGAVPSGADLGVTKTSEATGTLYAGDHLTYTIAVVNNGPADATGVTVTDVLPSAVTYVSNTCGGSFDGGTHIWTWNIGSLANAGSASCDLVVEVLPSANGPIVNTASVAGNETDPTPGNDASTASATASNKTPGIPALGGTGAGLLALFLAVSAMAILKRRLV